ncbi:uncharacterized protein PG998_008504 [Apiospora kogelbergensis]|uniref:uncharacterized protein n=1 Tax=Apiospora kogelbergensis TaxID=1337665 RepID=UPI00312CC3E5
MHPTQTFSNIRPMIEAGYRSVAGLEAGVALDLLDVAGLGVLEGPGALAAVAEGGVDVLAADEGDGLAGPPGAGGRLGVLVLELGLGGELRGAAEGDGKGTDGERIDLGLGALLDLGLLGDVLDLVDFGLLGRLGAGLLGAGGGVELGAALDLAHLGLAGNLEGPLALAGVAEGGVDVLAAGHGDLLALLTEDLAAQVLALVVLDVVAGELDRGPAALAVGRPGAVLVHLRLGDVVALAPEGNGDGVGVGDIFGGQGEGASSGQEAKEGGSVLHCD